MYCIRIAAPAKFKKAAAGHSAPSISDFKLEKRLCVTKGPDRRGHLMNGDVLVIDGQEGAVREKVMPYHVNIRLFASHAYCSDSRKKCTVSTLDMTILLFVV